MSDKKYKLLYDDFITYSDGTKVYRIQALKDIKHKDITIVKKGDIGGFVESEKNLSHEGSCWLYDRSISMNNAMVIEDSKLNGYSSASDDSIVGGNAIMKDHAKIYKKAKVIENAKLAGSSEITDTALISGNAYIDGRIYVADASVITDSAYIKGNAYISGSVFVGGKAILYGDEIQILHNASVKGEAFLKGSIMVTDNAKISGKAMILSLSRDNSNMFNISICKNAQITDNAKIEGSIKITDNAKVFDYARVYGFSDSLNETVICGDSQINGDYIVKYGVHRENSSSDIESIIYHVFGFYPTNGKIILYKLVNKDNSSIYNNCDFVFPEKGKVKGKDLKSHKSDEKFHFSTPEYWEYGSTFNQHKLLIAEIKVKDIKKIIGKVIIPKKVKIVGFIDKY